jgi:fumarate reductase subunit D
MIPVEVIVFGISLPLVAIALITRKSTTMRHFLNNISTRIFGLLVTIILPLILGNVHKLQHVMQRFQVITS